MKQFQGIRKRAKSVDVSSYAIQTKMTTDCSNSWLVFARYEKTRAAVLFVILVYGYEFMIN